MISLRLWIMESYLLLGIWPLSYNPIWETLSFIWNVKMKKIRRMKRRFIMYNLIIYFMVQRTINFSNIHFLKIYEIINTLFWLVRIVELVNVVMLNLLRDYSIINRESVDFIWIFCLVVFYLYSFRHEQSFYRLI